MLASVSIWMTVAGGSQGNSGLGPAAAEYPHHVQHGSEDTAMLVFTIFFGALIAMGSVLATIGFFADEAKREAKARSR